MQQIRMAMVMMMMMMMIMTLIMMASVKVESLEQKAKCGSSKMSQSSRGERRRSSLLPEEVTTSFKRCYFVFARETFVLQYFHYREKVRECEARLSQSMEVYRQRCDNLGVSRSLTRGKIEFRHVIMMRRMNMMVMDSVKKEILNKLKYGTLTF